MPLGVGKMWQLPGTSAWAALGLRPTRPSTCCGLLDILCGADSQMLDLRLHLSG